MNSPSSPSPERENPPDLPTDYSLRLDVILNGILPALCRDADAMTETEKTSYKLLLRPSTPQKTSIFVWLHAGRLAVVHIFGVPG